MGFNIRKVVQVGAQKALPIAAPAVVLNQKLAPMAGGVADKLLGKGNAVTGALDTSSGYVDKLTGQKSKEDTARDAAQAAAVAKEEMYKNLPQLQDRQGLGTLGDAGQFKSSTIAQSPWAALAQKQQGLSQGMAGDALARSNAVAAAQGRALGGMQRGNAAQGLESAGLANQGQIASSRLGLAAQGGQQRQHIAQQGAGRGLDVAQFNVGQQNQAAQANVGAQNQDINQQNAFNRIKFGEQMKFKGGQESGNALDKSKGGKK